MVQLDKAPKSGLSPERLAKRRRTNKRILIGAGVFAAFLVGIAAGGSSDGSASNVAATPAPTVTVTTSAAPAADAAPAPTVTVKETVTATPVPAAAPVAADGLGPGDWRVGVDVEPGQYRSSGVDGSLCYADTNDGAGNINEQQVTPEGPTLITISAKDKVFSTSGCEDFILQ